MTPTSLSVTVVISTRDRGALIADTLQTLVGSQDPNLSILVVDQSVDDTTREAVAAVAQRDPRVHYTRSKTVGLSAGRNVGASLSRSEIVAYTDDDCIVAEDWVQAIVREFEEPGIAAAYGRVLPHEYQGRTGTEVAFKDSHERVRYGAKTPPWYIGHGCNMAFRRAELIHVGGFDPLLGPGAVLRNCDDADMTYRLLAAGKRVVYSPEALVYHRQHWRDWRARQQVERAYGLGAGALFAKYLRCRDWYGVRLLGTWVWQLGVRRLGAGLLKWRSWRVMYLGYCQLVYPWIGIWKSRRYPIDRRRMMYVARAEDRSFSLDAKSLA